MAASRDQQTAGKAGLGGGGDETGSRAAPDAVAVTELAGHSRTVFIWTVVSRLTGFLRVALMAAVLGVTYFGNLYQTALFFPYVVCQLLMSSLISAILTPHLVRLIEKGRRDHAYRLACRFFGLALASFSLAACLTALAAPWVVPILTLAVDDPAVRAEQLRVGTLLVILMAPQVPLYGIAMTGLAVQRAYDRFALSTAAPAFENILLAVIIIASGLIYGVGTQTENVSVAQLWLLGFGSTVAVGLHAAAQWWGAHRCGMTLLPKRGWRDPELRVVLRLALPSSGNAILLSIGMMAMLIVAGGVPGGAVAYQVAYNLFNLPIALFARPIAAAQLPLLARRFAAGQDKAAALFNDALRLTLFVTVPTMLVFLVLPDLLATVVAFGGMRNEVGLALIAASIAGLAFGILGESVMVVGTSAAYARHNATTPFQAMAIQTGTLLLGLVVVTAFIDDAFRLAAIGLAFSTATLVAALFLYQRQVPAASRRMDRTVRYDLAGAALAVLAAWLLLHLLPMPFAPVAWLAVVEALLALATAGLVYLGFQHLCRSSQLALLLSTFRPDASGTGARAPAVTRQ